MNEIFTRLLKYKNHEKFTVRLGQILLPTIIMVWIWYESHDVRIMWKEEEVKLMWKILARRAMGERKYPCMSEEEIKEKG